MTRLVTAIGSTIRREAAIADVTHFSTLTP
jgi:hypothetical protein